MAEIPPFDIHAPMDAPIRAREMREKQEAEDAAKRMADPKIQAKFRQIVKAAAAKAGIRPTKKDGTPDRRFGPRNDAGFAFDSQSDRSAECASDHTAQKKAGWDHCPNCKAWL